MVDLTPMSLYIQTGHNTTYAYIFIFIEKKSLAISELLQKNVIKDLFKI